MALRDIFRINRKTYFDPFAWFGSTAQTNAYLIWNLIKTLFVPAQNARVETFEAAKERLKLTEEDLAKSQSNYQVFSFLFLIFAISTFFFSFYLLIKYLSFAGMLLGWGATSLFLAQAFRFNFFYFQIKHRKLGCTFAEWRSGKVNPVSSTKGDKR